MFGRSDHKSIPVWDLLVRLFHWSLAGFFLLAFLTEDEFMRVHTYSGYAIGLLLVFRLVWGFIGTHHARFHNFVTGPSAVLRYLRDMLLAHPRRYIGHNPAGAVMILLLMFTLALTVLSGMTLYGSEGHGPLAGTFLARLDEEWLEEGHEFFANLSVFLIAVHVGGVLISSLLHHENLVRAMITGRKPWDSSMEPNAPAKAEGEAPHGGKS